ncbi:MAG: glycoside hydrolase family 28 protein [Thermoflexales bacterium]|nr:glycoside hydrolase family 28 protein [Thermoflexales bacterium]
MDTNYFFNVLDYGAAGDGLTLDTRAFQAAIRACRQVGGGTVYVPAGRYVIGSIFLDSHVTLYLEAGATILGSENVQDYPVVEGRWEGTDRETYAPLIAGSDLVNVAVVGRGTIDGRGEGWWKLHREKALAYPRPRLISLTRCVNVLIEGITLANSPAWTVNPVNCENVTVDKVTILSPADSPNTDGINPDSCRNVHISNCYISVGDDCIAIKSGQEDNGRQNLTPCENITITNCTMAAGHGGVVIGSEMSGGVRNVVISNCVFTQTDRGIRFKSRRGRGGVVEDIRVTNIVMTGVLCPFTMNLYYACGAWGDEVVSDKRPRPVTEGTPHFRHIHLANITARGARYAAAFLYGLPEAPVEDVSLSDVSISMSPDAEEGYPEMADDMELMQRAGLFIRNARGLRLHNVEVTQQLGPALSVGDSTDIDIAACTLQAPPAGAPTIRMSNVDGAFVHGCKAAPGTGVFLRVEGENARQIVLAGNDLAQARQPIDVAEDVHPGALVG